jgi:hypothetical protein
MLILAAVTALLVLASCKHSSQGIFYSLETEEPIVQSNLNKDATVKNILRIDDTYYSIAGTVHYRDVSVKNWKRIASPPGMDYCTNIATLDDVLYASFISDDTSSYGLYSYDAVLETWSAVYTDMVTNELFSAGAFIFLCVSSDNQSHDLLSLSGGTVSSTIVLEDVPRIIDAAYDGTNYWFISSSQIFSGNVPSSISVFDFTAVAALEEKSNFRGLFYTDKIGSGKIFISSTDGYIFASEDGGTVWAGYSEDAYDISGIVIPFTDFECLSADIVVVGTENTGYFELAADLSAISTPEGNYYSSEDLTDSSIIRFFVDDAEEKLFACTARNGLWRNDFSGSQTLWYWE